MMIPRGRDGEEGRKVRAWCSTVSLLNATVLSGEGEKKEASSAWLGEKMSTLLITALWCSNVSGEHDLACGSQT